MSWIKQSFLDADQIVLERVPCEHPKVAFLADGVAVTVTPNLRKDPINRWKARVDPEPTCAEAAATPEMAARRVVAKYRMFFKRSQ